MKKLTVLFTGIFLMSFVFAAAALEDPIIFPKEGQTKEQNYLRSGRYHRHSRC